MKISDAAMKAFVLVEYHRQDWMENAIDPREYRRRVEHAIQEAINTATQELKDECVELEKQLTDLTDPRRDG